MKKYLIYTILFGMLFSACEPNKDIYQNIADKTKPYRTDLELTLTESDYATISDLAINENSTDEEISLAEAIDTYNSFSISSPASLYIGALLDKEYIAADSSSSALVTFDYSTNEYDSLLVFTLTDEDYIAIGGVVADSLAFTFNELPETFLPDYLLTLYETPNFIIYVKYEYWEDNNSLIDASIAYEYKSGAWVFPGLTYTLIADDYDSMGEDEGPGKYDNFSKSALPQDYLPTFLRDKYRSAIEGDQVFIFYKWHGGGASTRFDIFNFTENKWTNKTQHTEQFVHSGIQWEFDPTVSHQMIKEDYDILVQYILNHNDPTVVAYFDTQHNNSEFYFGASTYKDNFDMRLYKRRDKDPSGFLEGLSDDEAKVFLVDRIKEGLQIYLEIRFPEATSISNGVQVYYDIYYATYEPGNYYYKIKYKCTDTGKFVYESGPELLE